MAFNGSFLGREGEEANDDAEVPKGLEVGPGNREEPGFLQATWQEDFLDPVWIGLEGLAGVASTERVAFECRWERRTIFPRAFFRVLLC